MESPFVTFSMLTPASLRVFLKLEISGDRILRKSRGWNVGGWGSVRSAAHWSLPKTPRLDFRGARSDSGSDARRDIDSRKVCSS